MQKTPRFFSRPFNMKKIKNFFIKDILSKKTTKKTLLNISNKNVRDFNYLMTQFGGFKFTFLLSGQFKYMAILSNSCCFSNILFRTKFQFVFFVFKDITKAS